MHKPVMGGFPQLSLAPEILPSPAQSPLAPSHCFTGDRTESGRPARLRDGFARIGLRCEVDPSRDAPYRVDLSLSRLPGLQMAAGRLYGARSRRTRALLDTAADDTALIVNLKGRHLIEQRGREVELGDGDAVLVPWTEPARFTHLPPGEALALRFPGARLAPLLRAPHARYMQVIPGAAPGGINTLSLLTRYVALAWDGRMQTTPELQQLMVCHIYDLMAALIGATPDAAQMAQAGGLRAARLSAIKQDIEERLDRPELSLAEVAGRHGCTPRGVQRLFEAEGTTFTEHVLRRRIARAHRLLGNPHQAPEKISTIAYNCGFSDVSYFNRVFRRHYGMSPSDVRAQVRRA
jgi:AraC-like DNA-binding protein